MTADAKLLADVALALEDWIVSYADDMSDPERVRQACERFAEGGTLHYVAHLRGRVLDALKTPPSYVQGGAGATCSVCGFRYFEHHGRIIPCPRCELERRPAVPHELFSGVDVYTEVRKEELEFVHAKHVGAVLDAAVRLIRKNARARISGER